jgi:DNA-binding NtrC family response regulator
VAVNCATIPKELAERILFGARRGAYTGAVSDTVGLVSAADGGTLFLDELTELDLDVQAKLLRALETQKITPLGAVSPVAVQFRLCAASHKDLRAAVVEGRFREDLYFRIGRPQVRIPSLRERREEIPWLIEKGLAASATKGAAQSDTSNLTASAEFIEACLLRPWPGNVRELLAEIKHAALAATAAGRSTLAAADLDENAGRALAEEELAPQAEQPAAPAPSPEQIAAALRAEQGNVARAATRLGMARSRLRRFIERHGIDVKTIGQD